MPAVQKKWQLKTVDEEMVAPLAAACSVSPLLAKIMAQRGLTPETAPGFLSPSLAALHDPALLSGIDKAASRIARAIQSQEHICIYGDYDVDGVTSVSLLTDSFRQLGGAVSYYVPHRMTEGYGISKDGICKIVSDGAKVIVSVDCGITSVDEARLAESLGVDLIITDHHEPQETLPKAYALVNPLQPGCAYPFKKLAGVGVAFNLLMQVRRKLRERGHFDAGRREPNLLRWLDFVTLGTIADIVPLLDVNRTMVQFGLKELSKTSRPGICALKEVSGIEESVSCSQVGFRMGPRINAAGRLDDASIGVQLLLEEENEQAALKAAQLNDSNSERQRMEQEILTQALEMIENDPSFTGRRSIVLASESWHPGVIGIVASRLVEHFHLPVILIALDDKGVGKSSGRSIPTVDIFAALCTCGDLLLKFGGHTHAAGLSIAAENIPEFSRRFDAAIKAATCDEDFVPVLKVEAELKLSDATLATVHELAKLEPYGHQNPEPLFMFKELAVLDKKILKDKHMKLKLASEGRTIDAIAFGFADRFDEADGRIDVAAVLQSNTWQNREKVQLMVKDFRRAA